MQDVESITNNPEEYRSAFHVGNNAELEDEEYVCDPTVFNSKMTSLRNVFVNKLSKSSQG